MTRGIEDATGQAITYVYFRRDENEARQASVLTHDEARRIAEVLVDSLSLPHIGNTRGHPRFPVLLSTICPLVPFPFGNLAKPR